MFNSRRLVCGMCAVLVFACLPGVALAQQGPPTPPPPPHTPPPPPPPQQMPPTTQLERPTQSTEFRPCTKTEVMSKQCAENQVKAAQQAQAQSQYPNATRKEPKVKRPSAKEVKALQDGIKAANAGDSATALKDLQPLADGSSNAYARAMATLGLAQVKFHDGDTKGAIAMQKQALDSDSLDNDSFFPALAALAQMYIRNEDYTDALATLETWSKESGAKSADVYALTGNAYYRLQKYPEAVAAIQKAKALANKPEPTWDQVEMASYFAMDKYDKAAELAEAALAKDPTNSTLLQNAIAIYVDAHESQKALALLERAQANGTIKSQVLYMDMAKLYDNLGQGKSNPKPDALKAVAALQEGISKGVVQPGYDSYKLLGDSYAIAGDYKNALAAYDKAAPDAKTGDVDYQRGQLLEQLGRNREARDALKQAIAKGGFKPLGSAYLRLGNIELALKQKTAAVAAFKQAEQDPATRAEARRVLKKLGHK